MTTIYNIANVDLTKIQYGVAQIKEDMTNVPILCDNPKKKLFIQLPKLQCREWSSKNREICLQTDTSTSTFLTKLDEKILTDIKKNIKLWKLKGNNFAFKSLLKDGNIRLQIMGQDTLSTKVFDSNKVLISEANYDDNINDQCSVRSIVEISSLLFTGTTATLMVFPHQLKVVQNPIEQVIIEDYAFTASENDEA